ncbi:MAG: hypothetical protein GXY76_16540 [Chloroflexi bacterium]|nr:hypothetical protein [Chloroflexota bacterium]
MNDAPANVLTQAPAPRNDHLATTGCVLTVLRWGVLGLCCLLFAGIHIQLAPGLMLVPTVPELVLTGTSWREKYGRD